MTIKFVQYQSAASGNWGGSYLAPTQPAEFFRLPKACEMCGTEPMRVFTGDGSGVMRTSDTWIRGVVCPACGWWTLKGEHENNDFYLYVCDYTGEVAKYDIGDASVPLDVVARHLSSRFEDVRSVPPRKFEEFIGRIFREHFDCAVELTKQTRDGGKDLVCFDSNKGKFLVEVKNPMTPDKKIGLAIVQRFIGVLYQEKVSRGLIVSSSSYTRQAKEAESTLAASRHIIELELRDRDDILSWLDVIRAKASDEDELARIVEFAPWGRSNLKFHSA